MNPSYISVKTADVAPHPNEVTRISGFDPDAISDPLGDIIRQELAFVQHASGIQGGIRLSREVELHPDTGAFVFEGRYFKAGKNVLLNLEHSEFLAMYLFTAGEDISLRPARQFAAGNPVAGYFAGIAGALLVDRGVDMLHKKLAMDMKRQGFRVSNRFSPGLTRCCSPNANNSSRTDEYSSPDITNSCNPGVSNPGIPVSGNWMLEDQGKLLDCFPPDFCGIQLTQSGMMTPVKSSSGVIGAGKKVRFRLFPCHACPDTRCLFRGRKPRSGKFTCH